MIIVKLMGGLGNQMFQYAAARRLAQHHNTSLKLDLSFFGQKQEVTTRRVYGLDNLGVTASVATPIELAEITGVCKDRFQSIWVTLRRSIGFALSNPKMYEERHFHFDSALLNAPDNTYLYGYWQSEKYFKEIEDVIRNEFTVISEPDAWNRQMAEEINTTDSISVHVRRGDYVSDQLTSDYHGVCSLAYYQSAVDLMVSRVRSPRFFIFTDDPAWASENMKLHYPATFMDHNGPQHGHEDLRLMSLCKHHITANSSFSWWGAWLCNNPDKTVVSPERWFKNKDLNTKDLLPGNWKTIDYC